MNRMMISRRDLLRAMGVGALGVTSSGLLAACASGGNGAGEGGEAGSAGGTLTMADPGVGDPEDWSRFTDETGWDVNLVAIGNAPAEVVNVLQGGAQHDLVSVVGGMQKPLVENDLIRPVDTSRIPNWQDSTYITQFLQEGQAGFEFISHEGQVYGFPFILQGDSFAYLPQHTGDLDSYGAFFDEKWRGYVALEDNFTTTGQKTALYLKASGQAEIEDPADMTPEEITTVVDFLIEQKRAGQFRTIWSSFEEAVNLLTSEEVYVMDCWEPMVIAARDQGTDVIYAAPKEGYLLWALVAYIVNHNAEDEARESAVYDLINFLGSPWYGAQVSLLRGYMTNEEAIAFAAESDDFSEDEAQRVKEIHDGVRAKFEAGGTWQSRWPTHVAEYEKQWARFNAAPAG